MVCKCVFAYSVWGFSACSLQTVNQLLIVNKLFAGVKVRGKCMAGEF